MGQGSVDLTGTGTLIPTDFSINYDLSDINQPLEIVIPEGCDANLQTIPTENNLAEGDWPYPIITGATMIEKSPFDNTLRYEINVSVGEVVAFYKETMPANGWEFDEENSPILADMASLYFTKNGEELAISVTSRTVTDTTAVRFTPQTNE